MVTPVLLSCGRLLLQLLLSHCSISALSSLAAWSLWPGWPRYDASSHLLGCLSGPALALYSFEVWQVSGAIWCIPRWHGLLFLAAGVPVQLLSVLRQRSNLSQGWNWSVCTALPLWELNFCKSSSSQAGWNHLVPPKLNSEGCSAEVLLYKSSGFKHWCDPGQH